MFGDPDYKTFSPFMRGRTKVFLEELEYKTIEVTINDT